MEHLAGKVAVVTGAASGIGLGMARRLAAADMKLVLADIEVESLHAAAADLEATGATVLTQVCDVSDGDQVDALAEAAVDEFGAIHVACNNAGVGSGGPMWELTTHDWEWVLGVNLWGVIHGVRAFVPRMIEAGEGHVVNTASIAGLTSAPFLGPYNVSKHGVVTLSETLARELAVTEQNIGVSVLCPAWVRTQIHQSSRNRPQDLIPPDLEAEETAEGPAAGMAAMMESVIAAGMDPADVADRVHDAIVGNEFYILTHAEFVPFVEARHQAIVDRGSPLI
ncbi:MAG: SDR family NAD(P)-dependent oxidoreductase [Acidimicrobiales bacterium]